MIITFCVVPHTNMSSLLYRLCRGLAPDGTPLLSCNSALPLPEIFLRGIEYLVKLNKPPAIPRIPELLNISRTSSTERALMSLLSITICEQLTNLVLNCGHCSSCGFSRFLIPWEIADKCSWCSHTWVWQTLQKPWRCGRNHSHQPYFKT